MSAGTVFLVNPSYRELAAFTPGQVVRGIEPPHGLASLAACLERAGIPCELVDADGEGLGRDELLERLTDSAPAVIGFTVMTPMVRRVAALAKDLKARLPRTRILLGGVFPSAFPRRALDLIPEAEAAFIGEAEETLPAYLLGNIPSVGVLRQSDPVGRPCPPAPPPDPNSLPFPAYHKLPPLAKNYHLSLLDALRSPSGSFVRSRGCPFHCRFCDRSVTGTKYRTLSPERAVADVTRLVREHGLRHLFFHDDTFFVRRETDLRFFMLLRDAHLDLTFGLHIQPTLLPDDEAIRVLRAAGCRMVQIGVESAAPEVLKRLGKKVPLERVEACVRAMRRHGIHVKGLFMVGCPGETPETLARTFEFVRRVPFHSISVRLFTPYPGTPIAEDLRLSVDLDAEVLERLDLNHVTWRPDGLTSSELERAYYRLLGGFYLRPKTLARVAWQGLCSGQVRTLAMAFLTYLIGGVMSAR